MKGVVLVLLVGCCQAALVTEIIPREDSLFELRCPEVGGGSLAYWLLHGEGLAHPPDTVTEDFTVYNNGSIVFKSVKVAHAGRHLCVRRSEERLVAYPVTFRVIPRPSDNLWRDVYQYQFVTGLVAALVCLAIFGLSCLVYQRRWVPPKDGKEDTTSIVAGHDNPALTHDEAEDSNTHM